MSDPLSVAGSAVGIISLGIQVSQGLYNYISSVITAVRSAKQETSADMQAMFETLTSLMITQHEQSQSQLADIETHQRKLFQTGARLLQKPAALRDLCDTAGYDHSGQLRTSQFGQQGPMSSLCTCDLRQRETRNSAERRLFLGVTVYNQQYESFKHSAKCVFYKTQKRQDYGARFRVSFHHTLSFFVDLSLSYTNGAGGCSIGPHFRYKQMVQRSPASDLIRDFFKTLWSNSASDEIEDWDEYFALTERELLRLFQDGKVSPCDMSSSGTLLHVTVICGVILFNKKRILLQMDLLSKFVKTLIRVGVPCGEPGIVGRNVLSMFMFMLRLQPPNRGRALEKARTIAADIAQSHNFSTFFNSTHSDPKGFVRLLTDNRELVNALDIPPLIAAICLKFVGAVRSILNNSSQAILDGNVNLTVLHFASCWPTGLSLLLLAGAGDLINKGDQFNATALDYALEFSCKEACEILLSYEATWYHFPVNFVDQPKEAECIHCLARHLADRRKRLWCIAKETLSSRQLAQWKVSENEFPDARARFIVEQVLEAGACIPEVLMVPPDYEGIYISGILDLEQFPIFYDAGFHEINNRSTLGLLPLAYANTRNVFQAKSGASETAFLRGETFSWLKNHSYLDQPVADLQSLGRNTSATGWHLVALNLLSELPRDWTIISTLDPIHQFFYEFLGSRSRDSCNCWCSPHGCSPCTMWLKNRWLKDECLKVPDLYRLLYQRRPNRSLMMEDASRGVSTEFLTYITFEALEMTHTCCNFGRFVPIARDGCPHVLIEQFPGNVHEIQEEEEALGARLAYLVQEFECKLESSQHSLREFIYGYWSRRMAEECLPSHENMEALGEAGVNIDEIYESPIRLRWILGDDFDFKNCSQGRAGSIIDMDDGDHRSIPGNLS
ncbi:hypothetical protein BKA56DRAFT_728926 [Ilyonectria sp. MPI-CAGE-AT-0026]|nr:hypothetical protein BKA56DRAFT_728926 [Ilyonectria sp. MPI-CAGE-AT-0026]